MYSLLQFQQKYRFKIQNIEVNRKPRESLLLSDLEVRVVKRLAGICTVTTNQGFPAVVSTWPKF